MERRWRSIRQDGFRTHCHALWVGPKLVYRVTIETTFQVDQCDNEMWVAGVTKTKLDAFVLEASRLRETLQCPCSCSGEFTTVLHHVAQTATKANQEIFRHDNDNDDYNNSSSSNSNSNNSSVDTMTQREAMQAFVVDLLNAFGLITSMSVDSVDAAVLNNQMLRLYILLRNFLMIPDRVQDARNKLTLAVLSLQDIDPQLAPEVCCCICLDSCSDALLPTVKLPCDHVYHESCVMIWIRQSVQCPVCRAQIGHLPTPTSSSPI